jgi:DNA-binding SARP family transcriptional activator
VLAELLWERPPADVTPALRVLVHRIRQALGVQGSAAVTRGTEGYMLALPLSQTDHGRFAELVSAGVDELRQGAAESAGQLLESALQLWRGEPWQDLGDTVEIAAPRQRLTELRDIAVEELQAARLACGQAERAVAELQEAVMQAPYRERRWELLALALYRGGRQGEALAELRRVRELLIDDLGIEPGAALRALEQRMLDQDPALLVVDCAAQRRTTEQVSEPDNHVLERDDELRGLRELGRRALPHRDGRLVLVRGEAGVGKSTVIGRFVVEIGRTAHVVRGWCDPLSAPRPLGPLIDMLPQLPETRAASLAAAIDRGDPNSVYTELVRMFAGGEPWVWVIEDIHWADDATLDLLRFIARRVSSLPLLVLASYRDDEVGPQHPLSLVLGDLATYAAVSRVSLRPLSRDAVAVLTSGSGINADALHRLTGGNPFYITEVLAASKNTRGPDALPRTVAEAVWGRLGRLTEPARETALATAVCGPRVELSILEQVYPGAAAALPECLHAGVLINDGAAAMFRHELARRATLHKIPDYRRRQMHIRALSALEDRPVTGEALGALAFHASQAGDDSAVIRYAPAAGERAAQLGAHREAVDFFALALRHGPCAPIDDRLVWLQHHAFESYLCGHADAAASSWQEAIGLCRRVGNRLAESDNLRWLSLVLWPMGRSTEAIEAGGAAVRLLDDVGPCPQLAWALINLAQMALLRYDPAAADYAKRAATLGVELGLPEITLRANGYRALVEVLRTDAGWGDLEAAWRSCMGSAGLVEDAAALGALACWAAVVHRDVDRADSYICDMSTFCEEHDLGMFGALATGAGALAALARGEWSSAASSAERVLTWPGLSPMHRIMPLVALALVHARQGRGPVAALLDEALRSAEHDDVSRLGMVWAARAEAAWLSGDQVSVRRESHCGFAITGPNTDPWVRHELQRWVWLAGDDCGSTDGPVTPYALEIAGKWSAAAVEWSRRGCRYEAALAKLGGDVGAVESALASFRELNAPAAARRAEQRLAALKARAPVGPSAPKSSSRTA